MYKCILEKGYFMSSVKTQINSLVNEIIAIDSNIAIEKLKGFKELLSMMVGTINEITESEVVSMVFEIVSEYTRKVLSVMQKMILTVKAQAFYSVSKTELLNKGAHYCIMNGDEYL